MFELLSPDNFAYVLKTPPFFAAISTRFAGNQSFTYGIKSEVEENRHRFLAAVSVLAERVYFARVNHTTNLAMLNFHENNTPLLEKAFGGRALILPPNMETGFDGYFSFSQGWFIAFSLADCVPLFVCEAKSGLYGLIHTGLLGALNGIVYSLVPLLHDYHINPSEVSFHLGPCISQRNYNLQYSGLWKQIREPAILRAGFLSQYLSANDEGEYIDMRQIIVDQLLEIGASWDRISHTHLCTAEPNSLLYSNHAAKTTSQVNGRFMVMLGCPLVG